MQQAQLLILLMLAIFVLKKWPWLTTLVPNLHSAAQAFKGGG